MISIFEELDKFNLEISKEKRKKKYRLNLYNSLYQNGYFAEMGNATPVYEILGDKCTCQVTMNGQIWYLVYGGKYSHIVNELSKILNRTRKTIRRYLNHLKKLGLIQYETSPLGSRIAVKPIEGAFEKNFNTHKSLGQNYSWNGQEYTGDGSKQPKGCEGMTQVLGQNTPPPKRPSEEIPNIINGNPNFYENQESCTRTIPRTGIKTTTTSELDDVASEIIKILNNPGKGKISLSTIEDRITGKDPAKMKAYALMAAKKATSNIPGYWLRLVKEEPHIELEENDTYQPPEEYPPWVKETDNYPFNRLSIKVRKEIVGLLGREKGYAVFMGIIEQFDFLEHRREEELTPEEIQKIRDFIEKEIKKR